MSFTFSDKRTSLLIGEQVPEFLHDYEDKKFIKFIEKYYEWMETSRIEVSIEYLGEFVDDLEIDLSILKEDKKPQIQGLHTNSLSRILSIDKVDRNNYVFNVKHYMKDFETPVQLVNPYPPPNSITKNYSVKNEISKGYSVEESLIFLNSPFSSLTEKDERGRQKIQIKVKSFIQQAQMASKNSWNSNDVDLTLNNLIDLFMKDFLDGYPLSFPTISESLDINDKITQNYTLEDFKRFLVKHSREFYRSKGTEDSFRYLFRTIFNQEIDMYYPSEDILKASDNTYFISRKIRVNPNINFDANSDLSSKYIYGETSGSSAVIEKYFYMNNSNKFFIELYLNYETLKGNFIPNENLRILNESGNFENIGTAISSLKNVKILKSSSGKFKLGERIFFDKNLKRIDPYQIPLDLKSEYIEIEVDRLEGGEIYGFEILNSGEGYFVGDEIVFDHSDSYISSKSHRFVKAYVSEVDDCNKNSIKKIKVVCAGKGLISLPRIVKIGIRDYNEEDPKNAKLSFLSKNIGKVKTARVVNSGFNYPFIGKKNDSNGDFEFTFGVDIYQEGSFLNNNGFLSDVKVLQDSEYYQKFSYVIKSSLSPKDYKDLTNRLVHPAGMRSFGEYSIVNKVNAKIKVNERKLNEIELNDRNYIGKYGNIILDEWSLYDNFDNVEIRHNDLIPTIIKNGDDYKFLKLNGIVNLTEGSNIVTGIGTNFLSTVSAQDSFNDGDFVMIQNQGFYVVAINNDSEMIVSQESNETLTSENILIRTVNIDTAG